MNIPGFTGEHSLHRTAEHFHTGVPDAFRVFNTEVRPQLICQWNGGDLICGDEPFGGTPNFGGDHSYPQCRARCYHTKRGAALRECLADC
jgi:hypothetical protein